ncbi:MAG TPA: hypothetical protein VN749_18385 [Candidatus Eisenbacteria bacterium]|jgi:hypothetical protein|nr:hypothetical protein [Candidatus Eisenbacteria bacterium]
MEVYEVHSGSQEAQQFDPDGLDAEGRRLFLGAMLRHVTRRYSCGQRVLRGDLRRLVALADDADGSNGAPA